MALHWNSILLIIYKLVNWSTLKKNICFGKIFKLVSNKFEVLVPPLYKFYFIFKWFCIINLHNIILKLAFFGLGWAQVYRSQLGPRVTLASSLFFLGGGEQGSNEKKICYIDIQGTGGFWELENKQSLLHQPVWPKFPLWGGQIMKLIKLVFCTHPY